MNNIVDSKRIIYTPSDFAKESLLYVQEIGQSTALKKHTSSRDYLDSYLLFIVVNGDGKLFYNKKQYYLPKGSIVFIDCNKPYSHTSDNWTIKWIHFNGRTLNKIYSKYISRGGKFVFESSSLTKYQLLIDNIYNKMVSNEYIVDMFIYDDLSSLLTLLMSETIYKISNSSKNKYNIKEIKDYIDNNIFEDLSLDDLSNKFYINKYYLTRLFKDSYSVTIISYITSKRIAASKEQLRFSNKTIEQIADECNIKDSNYFSRVFRKIEGITPKQYRERWKPN